MSATNAGLHVTREAVRFLLGELAKCPGVDGFGCDASAPGIRWSDATRTHYCDSCSSQRGEHDAPEAPHAALVRDLVAFVGSSTLDRELTEAA